MTKGGSLYIYYYWDTFWLLWTYIIVNPHEMKDTMKNEREKKKENELFWWDQIVQSKIQHHSDLLESLIQK